MERYSPPQEETDNSFEAYVSEKNIGKGVVRPIVEGIRDDFKKIGINVLETISQKFGETAGKKVYEYLRLKTEKFDTDIIGLENIVNIDGSFVIAPNHTRPNGQISLQTGAHPDIVLLERVVDKVTGVRPSVAAKGDPGEWGNSPIGVKKNVIKPIMTGIVRGLGFIPVNLLPGTFNREMVEKVAESVNQDRPIIIAPEGRSYEEFSEENEFKTGIAHFALKHSIPIVPVFIKDCRDWEEGSKNMVIFGEPIYPEEGMSKADLVEEAKASVVRLSEEASFLGHPNVNSE